MTPEQMRTTASHIATTPELGDRLVRFHDYALQLCATIDSLTVQRDAAEALAMERQDDRDETVRAFRLDREDLTKRADAAQQMVAELRLYLAGAESTFAADGRVNDAADLRQALALSAPIANRWCLASERDEAKREAASLGRIADAAIDRAEKAEALVSQLRCIADISGEMAQKAERRESELGLQVVAQAARLRLADDVVEAARGYCTRYMPRLIAALAAWDAVPGDQG